MPSDRVGTAFYMFGLVLLPTLAFVGLVTCERVLQCGVEDLGYARRIALLRGYYFDEAPELAPYLMSVPEPDRRGRSSLPRRTAGWSDATAATTPVPEPARTAMITLRLRRRRRRRFAGWSPPPERARSRSGLGPDLHIAGARRRLRCLLDRPPARTGARCRPQAAVDRLIVTSKRGAGPDALAGLDGAAT
jgi:hypothetical protein